MTHKEKIYKLLYKLAKATLEDLNLCEHDKNGLCIRERDKKSRGKKVNKYCCCGRTDGKSDDLTHCQYLIEKSCSIENLDCFTWYCKIAQKTLDNKYPEKAQIIKLIRNIAERKRFLQFRKKLY